MMTMDDDLTNEDGKVVQKISNEEGVWFSVKKYYVNMLI